MKLRIAFISLAAIWTVALALPSVSAEQAVAPVAPVAPVAAVAPVAQAGAAKTVWDGVFTEEQAKRGELAYKDSCSSCHGGDLGGDGFAPALAGADFGGNWNDLSVGDLYERIRISMPQSAPGSLTRQQNSDILSYMLRKMNNPVGTTELSTSTDELKAIKFLAEMLDSICRSDSRFKALHSANRKRASMS